MTDEIIRPTAYRIWELRQEYEIPGDALEDWTLAIKALKKGYDDELNLTSFILEVKGWE